MKRVISFCMTAVLTWAIINSCKKHDKTEVSPPDDHPKDEFRIAGNLSLAGEQDALQAVYASETAGADCYFYGSFSNLGEPGEIKSAVLKSRSSDTALNVFFDKAMQAKRMFITVGSKKLNYLLSFDYDTPDSIVVSTYYVDFASDSSRLLHRYTVNSHSGALTSQTSYASFGSGLLTLLGGGGPTGFINDLSMAVTGLSQMQLATVLLYAGAGCAFGPASCVIGAAVGIYKSLEIPDPVNTPQAGMEEEPVELPPAPQEQIAGTHWSTLTHYTVMISSFGSMSYGGVSICKMLDTWTDVYLEIEVNNENHTVVMTRASGWAARKITDGRKGCPNGQFLNNERLPLYIGSAQISGKNIELGNPNPQNYSVIFSGTVSESAIQGTLSITANSGELAYTLARPVVLKSIF